VSVTTTGSGAHGPISGAEHDGSGGGAGSGGGGGGSGGMASIREGLQEGFGSGIVDVTIPDDDPGGVCVPIDVATVGRVSRVLYVSVSLDHTAAQDLRVVLVAPSVDRYVTLMSRPDGSQAGPDFAFEFPVTFVDWAELGADDIGRGLGSDGVICEANGNTDFHPQPGVFSDVEATDLDGAWRLCVSDESAGDVGRLHGWQFAVSYD